MKRTNKSADPRYEVTRTEELRRYEVALHKPYTTKKGSLLKTSSSGWLVVIALLMARLRQVA